VTCDETEKMAARFPDDASESERGKLSFRSQRRDHKNEKDFSGKL